MVFQSSKKKISTTTGATDFKDLELVKQAEEKAMLDIQNAKKRAEKILVAANQGIIAHKVKTISELTAKLERQYKQDEKKAIHQAEKIKGDGELEAEKLKKEVLGRIPKAVDHIVKTIIND